jgi:hypothetical protein
MKREVEEANKILIDKKEEMDRVSKVWHGQGLDEERGGGGQQDPHRQEGRDGQGIHVDMTRDKMKTEFEELEKKVEMDRGIHRSSVGLYQ